MSKAWFYIGLIAFGVLLALFMWPDDPPPAAQQRADRAARELSATAPASRVSESLLATNPEVEELHRRLDDESRARRELERRLLALEREIAALRAAAPAAESYDSDPDADGQGTPFDRTESVVADLLDRRLDGFGELFRSRRGRAGRRGR